MNYLDNWRKENPEFNDFDDAVIIRNLPKIEPGRFGGMTPNEVAAAATKDYGTMDALKGGFKSLASSVGLTVDAWQGDVEGASRGVAAAQEIERTPQQKAFLQDLSEKEGDGWLDAAGNIASAIWENPEGAWHEMVAQTPNMLPSMGGMIAGGKAGAMLGGRAGLILGPKGAAGGAVVGALVGSLAGAIGGATLVETGGIVQEKAHENQGLLDAGLLSEARGEGLTKGAVIGSIDRLGVGVGKFIMSGPGKAATAKVYESLAAQGVDITSEAAVKAAMNNPVIKKIASEAAADTIAAANSLALRTGRNILNAATETSGEVAGEYLGSVAAGQEASKQEALLEGFLSAPMSAAQIVQAKIESDGAKSPDQILSEALAKIDQAKNDAIARGGDALDGEIAKSFAAIDEMPKVAKAADEALSTQSRIIGEMPSFETAAAPERDQTAADLGIRFPPQSTIEAEDATALSLGITLPDAAPSLQRETIPRDQPRDMTGLDGLITLADRMGFADEVARLTVAKRLYASADRLQAEGDTVQAQGRRERADAIYRSVTEGEASPVREYANQFPVPYEYQGDIGRGGEIIPSTAPNFTMRDAAEDIEGSAIPVPTNLLEDQARGRLGSEGMIYGQAPEVVTGQRSDLDPGVGQNVVDRMAQRPTGIGVDPGHQARQMTADQVRNAGRERIPEVVWAGTKGDGYPTEQAARTGIGARERAAPELDWQPEQMPSGRWQVAGYPRAEAVSESAAAGPPQAAEGQAPKATDSDPGNSGSVAPEAAESAVKTHAHEAGEHAAMRGFSMHPPSSVRKKSEREAWEDGWMSGKRKRDIALEGLEPVTFGGRVARPTLNLQNAVVWRDEGSGRDYDTPAKAVAGMKQSEEALTRLDDAQPMRQASAKTALPEAPPSAAASEADTSTAPETPKPVLQNRNRATAASIEQMTGIAANPDYFRLSPSRDFANGAPVVEPGAPVVATGKSDTAVTASGRRIPVQYAAVEADTLLPSNNVDGTANAGYAAGEQGKSRAIAGNGRVAGLQAAFRQNTAAQYVEDMVADDMHGIDPDAIRGMRNPVLVRVMPGEEVTDTIGDESNTTGTAQLSPSEQARNDARRIDVRGIALNEEGEITRQAVEQFVATMPQAEKSGLLDGQNPNRQAYDRLGNVIFAEAYESDTLLRLQAEAADPEVRTIMSGLRIAAGRMAQLKGAGAYDIRALVVEAAEVAVNARRAGQPLAQYIQQADIGRSPKVQAILKSFAENIRSAKKIGQSLSGLADTFYAEYARADADMFGTVERRTPDELMRGSYGTTETEARGRQDAGQPRRGDVAERGNEGQPVREQQEGAGQSRAQGRPSQEGVAPTEAVPQGAVSRSEAEDFSLNQETEAQRAERERNDRDAIEQAANLRKAEEDKAKSEADKKATRQAADTSIDRFELGQDAEQQLSGQETMFSKSPTKNAHTTATIRAALEKAFPGVFERLERAGLARVVTSDQLPESVRGKRSVSGSNTPAALIESLSSIHPEVDAFLSTSGDRIRLDMLKMPEAIRGQGLGSRFMETLTAYADENGMTITLTAAGDFGGSKAAQQRFYKRHGFEMNQGRNKDFSVSDNMIRQPVDIRRSSDGNILAYVQNGIVTFVADNIPKGHNVKGLMLHEIGVHLNKLGKSDKDFQAILKRLEFARKAGNKDVRAAFDRVPDDTPAHLVTEEAAGYLVESARETTLAKQIATWMKAKLKEWIRTLAKGRDLMALTRWANGITQDEMVMLATAGVKSANADTIAQNDGVMASMADGLADTKVVDENGKPLTVYHATSREFDQFSPLSHFGTAEAAKQRIETTREYEGDANRAERTVAVQLNIQNPLEVEDNGLVTPLSVAEAVSPQGVEIDDGAIRDGLIAWAESLTPEQSAKVVDAARLDDDASVEEIADAVMGEFAQRAKFAEDVMAGGDIRDGIMGDTTVLARAVADAIEDAGYDGLTYTNDVEDAGSRSWVVLRPDQAVADTNPDIRYSRAAEAEQESFRPIRSGIRDRLDAIRFQVQDKLIDLKRAQEGIQSEDDANPYQKAAIWEGKAGERLNDFDESRVQPLLAKVAETGLSLDEVGNWLVARHAREANAYLAEINPDKPAEERNRLSGMSNEEAVNILADNAGNAALTEVGRMVDQINKERVDMLVEEGLITAEMAAQWRGRYKHYVPLNREEAEGGDHLPSRGQGFNIKGKESKMRTGSAYWTPGKILSHTIANMESSIVRAEKNQVGKALLAFIEQNPDDSFWTIETDRTAKSVRNGKVVEGPRLWDAPHELTVKRDGVEYVIAFNPQNQRAMRLVSGMKNLQAAQMGTVMRAMAKVTRFLASVNTSWNPEFMVSNFLRDVQTAAYNLSDTEISDMKGRVLKDIPKAMNGIRSALFGDGSAEWAEVWEDFRKHGGKTGWLDIHSDIQAKERDLTKMVSRLQQGKPSRGAFIRFLNAVEGMNNVIENGVRVAAYKNALDAGLSKDQAAALAKDLTVNFNRKGNNGPTINALYMFFNAAVQGNVRLLQAMANSKQGRRLAYSTIGFAVFLDILNRSLSGDDDDGENIYDTLPDYVKNHNIIIMGAEEPIVKIPAPWGYNVLHTIGQVIGEAATGERFNATDAAARVGLSIIDAFNPVGSGTIAQVISPTVTDPIVQMAENKSFSGAPLKPEHTFDAGRPKPEYLMHWSTAREMSKDIAEWLNDATGGNEVRPGAINVSPEWIDLIVDTATGGLGRMGANALDVTTRLVQGEEIPTENTPFLRKVTGFNNEYGIKGRYYEWGRDVAYAKAERKTLKGEELREAIKQPSHKLIPAYETAEKQLRNLRKLRRTLEQKGAPQERIDAIDARIRDVMARFNKRYAEVMFN